MAPTGKRQDLGVIPNPWSYLPYSCSAAAEGRGEFTAWSRPGWDWPNSLASVCIRKSETPDRTTVQEDRFVPSCRMLLLPPDWKPRRLIRLKNPTQRRAEV